VRRRSSTASSFTWSHSLFGYTHTTFVGDIGTKDANFGVTFSAPYNQDVHLRLDQTAPPHITLSDSLNSYRGLP
jgi:hypothetical protein